MASDGEGKIQEAIESGVSAEDMGLDVTDLDYHLPDEQTVASKQPNKADEFKQRNAEPIPPGTPDAVARMFRAIPYEKIRTIRAHYDRFDENGQDMTFCDFAVEYAWLTSPAAMSQDLQKIAAQKATGMARKTAIDSLINPN